MSESKFSPPHFLQLRDLTLNTVGVNNYISDIELKILLSVYKSLVNEIDTIEKVIEEDNPHYMSVTGIEPLSTTVIHSEYRRYISIFSNPGQMLAFARIEPDVNESHGGHMEN